MKKVLIIGSPGAGKSTLSYRLREILGIKSVHLDCYFGNLDGLKFQEMS